MKKIMLVILVFIISIIFFIGCAENEYSSEYSSTSPIDNKNYKLEKVEDFWDTCYVLLDKNNEPIAISCPD